MANVITGSIDVNRNGATSDHFIDEFGDLWIIAADDGHGWFAVNREDGDRAGMVRIDRGLEGRLYAAKENCIFGIIGPADFVVVDGEWARNNA